MKGVGTNRDLSSLAKKGVRMEKIFDKAGFKVNVCVYVFVFVNMFEVGHVMIARKRSMRVPSMRSTRGNVP